MIVLWKPSFLFPSLTQFCLQAFLWSFPKSLPSAVHRLGLALFVHDKVYHRLLLCSLIPPPSRASSIDLRISSSLMSITPSAFDTCKFAIVSSCAVNKHQIINISLIFLHRKITMETLGLAAHVLPPTSNQRFLRKCLTSWSNRHLEESMWRKCIFFPNMFS